MSTSQDMLPEDRFASVRPKTGPLALALERVLNPRKHRWNRYRRACKAIPKHSPVHGSTSFRLLNERRLALIDDTAKTPAIQAEYKALKRACSSWVHPSMIGINFLLARYLRSHDRRKKATA